MIGSLRGTLVDRPAPGEVHRRGAAGSATGPRCRPSVLAGLGRHRRSRCSSTSTPTCARTPSSSTASPTPTSGAASRPCSAPTASGPSLALAILSSLSPAALSTAVLEDDVDTLCLVPGVGKKTAARLLLELKARLDLPTAGRRRVRRRRRTGSARGRGAGRPGRARLRARGDPRGAGRRRRRRPGRGAGADRRCASWPGPMTPEARREVLAERSRPSGADRRGRRPTDRDRGPAGRPRRSAPAEEAEEAGLRPRTLDEFVGQGQLTEHLRIVIEAALKRQPAGRPPAVRRAARAGQDLAGRHRGRRDGRRAPDHRRARCWSGRATWPPCSPTCRRATSCSSTRSTGSTGRSRRSSIRPWRTSSSTSSSARGRRPAASGSTCPASPWSGPPPAPGWWPAPCATGSASSAGSTTTTSTSSQAIVTRSAGILGVPIDAEGARRIAERSRGTPADRQPAAAPGPGLRRGPGRGSHHLGGGRGRARGVRRRRARASTRSTGPSSTSCAAASPAGPVGLTTLAQCIGEEPDTIEDAYEPYLLQQGLLQRTPRGRVAAPRAWAHLGPEPRSESTLL